MKNFFVFFCFIFLFGSVAFAAEPYVMTTVNVPWSYGIFVASYANGHWMATDSSGSIFELDNNQWKPIGIKGSRPVWTKFGVMFYDADGYLSLLSGAAVSKLGDERISRPVSPIMSPEGDICYGSMTPPMAFIRHWRTGAVLAGFPVLPEDWLTSLSFAPSGAILAAGQDPMDPVNNGFQTFVWKDGIRRPLNFPASQICWAGGKVWLTSFDHRQLWSGKYSSGQLFGLELVDAGGYYSLLGADESAALVQVGSLYWRVSDSNVVPEPASLLVLGTLVVLLKGRQAAKST